MWVAMKTTQTAAQKTMAKVAAKLESLQAVIDDARFVDGISPGDKAALKEVLDRIIRAKQEAIAAAAPKQASAPMDIYAKIEAIRLPGSHFRSDIGLAAAQGRISI